MALATKIVVTTAALVLVAAPSIASTSSARPDPAVSRWPSWPYPTSCDHGVPFDPVVAFSGPLGAENGPGGPEVALREEVKAEKTWAEPLLAPHGWRKLSETGEVVEFARGRLPKVEVVQFNLKGGKWKLGTYDSGCEPVSLVEGQPAITWTLARKQQKLVPATRTLLIDLGPGPCDGGKSQDHRAMKPIFWYRGRRLFMLMRLRPLPPGNYSCVGTVEPPLKVSLPGRLGNRQLFDGGVFPPAHARRNP